MTQELVFKPASKYTWSLRRSMSLVMDTQFSVLRATKDRIVTCHSCNTDLYKFVVDIRGDDPIKASQFEAVPGIRQITPFDAIECPICGVFILEEMRRVWQEAPPR